MPKQKTQKPLEQCETLCSLEAPGFIQEFHNAAIGSVSMMAGAFTGLAKALQAQNDRSDSLQQRLQETNDTLQKAQESMKETESLVRDLAQRIEEQLSDINARFEKVGAEMDEKLEGLNQELRDEIAQEAKRTMDKMAKECKKMISKVANQVKNTENQIKNLTKTCQDNRDKIQLNKGAVDQVRSETKQLQKDMKDEMKELNTYVEKTTTDMKDLVQNTTDKLNTQLKQMDEGLQDYKFQTNQALDRKADLEDLKRKMDIAEFKEFNQAFKEYQEKMDTDNEKLGDSLDNEVAARKALDESMQSSLGTAETARREIREDLDYVKKRVTDVPDPTELVARTQQELMDYINQVEACLREEMKARLQTAGSPKPVFGNADGTCFSCGRSPTTSAFPPMPSRSPKNSTGGGFKSATTPKRGSRGAVSSQKNLREQLSPKKRMSAVEKSMTLPELPGQEVRTGRSTHEVEDIHLPAVETTERPRSNNDL